MQYTQPSYSSDSNTRLTLAALCVASLVMVIVLLIPGKFSALGSGRGIALGIAVSALLFGGIILFQRNKMDSLLSQMARLSKRTDEATARAASLIAEQAVRKEREMAGKSDEDVAERIAMTDLTEMAMDPMRDDDGFIFRYQGGFFRMTDVDNKIVRIIYPRIYTVPVTQQNLLARMLNRINSGFQLVKLTAQPAAEENAVTVYAFADILYTSRVSDRKELLRSLLATFFDAQHALALSMTAAQIKLEPDVSADEVTLGIEEASLN